MCVSCAALIEKDLCSITLSEGAAKDMGFPQIISFRPLIQSTYYMKFKMWVLSQDSFLSKSFEFQEGFFFLYAM